VDEQAQDAYQAYRNKKQMKESGNVMSFFAIWPHESH
jgi:hypothetical protein